MIRIILLITFFVFFSLKSNADNISKSVSNFVNNIIPGEGITETSIDLSDSDEDSINFSILALREINTSEFENFFTQFSFMNQEINDNNRLVGNIGLGYRSLSDDKSMIFGSNIFYDTDILNGHHRLSFGLEAKAEILDFNLNIYQSLSNQVVVDNIDEKVMDGYELSLSSQIPYMPWSKFNFTDYEWEKEKAIRDTSGDIYGLEVYLSPTLSLEAKHDNSSNSNVDDENSLSLTFIYPPDENRNTLRNGFLATEAFEKRDMSSEMKKKVRRNNKIVLETQGSIIITKK